MSVKAPAERNFRRARVKPARRKRFRPHLPWTMLRRIVPVVLFAVGIYEAVALAYTTPLLRVRHIAVKGNVRLSSGQVQSLVEDLRGTSILSVDLDAFRRRLVESPWVADVALRRVLPGTIEVFVSERRPVGLGRLGQDLYLIDESGVVIDQFGAQYAEFDLPIIDGLVSGPAAGIAQGTIDPNRAQLASRLIAALGQNRQIGARLSQLDVSDSQDAVVLLENDSALLHVGNDRFLERVQAYLDLSTALRERVADIDYVDLRFNERVYVRPASDGGRKPAGTHGQPAPARHF
jgi:cell division septal protein FtsQ